MSTFNFTVRATDANADLAYSPQSVTVYAPDPYFANVVSLAHFNGPNNSTTMPDEKGGSFTPYGGCVISTAKSAFGGSSLKSPGTSGSYAKRAFTPIAITSSSIYTLELQVNPNSLAGLHGLCNINTGSGNQGINLYHNDTVILSDNGNAGGTGPGFGTIATDANYFLQLIADGTNTKSYVNGVLKNTYAGITGAGFTVASAMLMSYYSATSSPANAHIDEFRFTWGVARAPTVQLEPWPDS